MRTNPAGVPGKYSCDRCLRQSPSGVMTGDRVFAHLCLWCYDIRQKLPDLMTPGGILRVPDDWMTPSLSEIEKRALQAEKMRQIFSK